MRSENYKVVFNDYFFYYNAFDPNDRNNPKESRILPNPHVKLQNPSTYSSSTVISQGSSAKEEKIIYNNQNYYREIQGNTSNQVQGSSQNQNSFALKNSSSHSQVLANPSNLTNNQSGVLYKKIEGSGSIGGDIKVMTNLESKFNKIKQMSNSGSASSLLRQYRVSGISSLSGTGNNQNQVSNFSSLMSNQNKSLVGSFTSNNSNSQSTSTNSNSNQNYNLSGNNMMRKSGSTSYMGK